MRLFRALPGVARRRGAWRTACGCASSAGATGWAARCARQIEAAEAATAGGERLHAAHRHRLLAPATPCCAPPPSPPGRELDRDEFAALLGRAIGDAEPAPDVDLLVRTGGEQRLSDFLLWECAYAELYFTPRMWPEFGAAALAEAVDWFAGRERRFGTAEECVREVPSAECRVRECRDARVRGRVPRAEC